MITVFVSGFLFAQYMTDTGPTKNMDYQRPDFKPKAAMVKDTSMLYDEKTEQQIKAYYKLRSDPEARKRSTWYRFFFPLDADYSVTPNPWSN